MSDDDRQYEWVKLPNGMMRYQPVNPTARKKNVDPWRKHYSLSMGAPTEADAAEIAERCKAHGVSCEFDEHLRIKVNSEPHQKELAKVRFPGQNVRNRGPQGW